MIEKEFDIAMMDIYHRAKYEAGYNATRYLQMLQEHRGLGTAKILLHTPHVSDGFTALWELGTDNRDERTRNINCLTRQSSRSLTAPADFSR